TAVPAESRSLVLAEAEAKAVDVPDWVFLLQVKRVWCRPQEALEAVQRAEKQFPGDALILRQKVDVAFAAEEWQMCAEAYVTLSDLDPGGKASGPRPFNLGAIALQSLAIRDVPLAFGLAMRILQDPALDAAMRQKTQAALRSGWELTPGDYWTQLKKAKLPRPPRPVEEALRAHIERLSSEEFKKRAEASDQLRKGGVPALAVLVERVDDPDAEVRSRVRDAIRSILTGD